MDVSFVSSSAEDTAQFGREFARGLESGDVIALAGELGCGKTQLVKGICQGLGFNGEVTSPSFVKIHQYDNDPPLIHADLYLLNSELETADLGLDEFNNGRTIIFVEWAQKFPDLLPKDSWWITIDMISGELDKRRIKVSSGYKSN